MNEVLPKIFSRLSSVIQILFFVEMYTEVKVASVQMRFTRRQLQVLQLTESIKYRRFSTIFDHLNDCQPILQVILQSGICMACKQKPALKPRRVLASSSLLKLRLASSSSVGGVTRQQ
ncbi:hypothetical protein GRI39_09635 [Altererythrobacter indicus]|uniref:Uncharacterized protein n=1 Tax=Altericroceibacterium indicum TaxID=374177 RepID=A0A845ACL6_9SPHN|nr:hypothetical protein [Altericroceibacterium indicum]MXP26296.1 hypothetical protein [Altericroceibacterium indicum]